MAAAAMLAARPRQLAALLLPLLLPLLLAQPPQGAGKRYSVPLDEAYPWAVPSEEAVRQYRYACKHQRNLNRAAAAFDAGVRRS